MVGALDAAESGFAVIRRVIGHLGAVQGDRAAGHVQPAAEGITAVATGCRVQVVGAARAGNAHALAAPAAASTVVSERAIADRDDAVDRVHTAAEGLPARATRRNAGFE